MYIWKGPTGSNVKLGYVENGKEVIVPEKFIDYFKERNLIEIGKKMKTPTKTKAKE